MVRQDESGKQFGRVVHSFPKIVGEQQHRVLLASEFLSFGLANQGHRTFDLLREVGKKAGGGENADIVQ